MFLDFLTGTNEIISLCSYKIPLLNYFVYVLPSFRRDTVALVACPICFVPQTQHVLSF